MADYGILARLTQQASDNIYREHNFRSALYAQARQEIQQDRQLRLQESNAIANRMAQADENIARREQNAIMNQHRAAQLAEQKAYHNARIKDTGGFGAIIPELPSYDRPSDGFATDPDNPAARGRGDSFIPPTSNQVPVNPQTQEDNEVLARVKQNAIARIGTLEQQRALLKGREPKPPRYKNPEEQKKYDAAYAAYKDALANKEAEIIGAKTDLEKLSVPKERKQDAGPSRVDIESLNGWISKIDIINAALADPKAGSTVRLPGGNDVSREQAEILKKEAERNVTGLTNGLSPSEKAALGVPQTTTSTQGTAVPNPNVLREKAIQGNADAKNILNLLK